MLTARGIEVYSTVQYASVMWVYSCALIVSLWCRLRDSGLKAPITNFRLTTGALEQINEQNNGLAVKIDY